MLAGVGAAGAVIVGPILGRRVWLGGFNWDRDLELKE